MLVIDGTQLASLFAAMAGGCFVGMMWCAADDNPLAGMLLGAAATILCVTDFILLYPG